MSEKKLKRKVIRISMLGDSTVGKTSIINVFLNREFSNDVLSNIGVDKNETKMTMPDGKEMKLIIWDTAGQERFHSIATNTIKNCQGIVVTFDLTNRKSFDNVVRWLGDIREYNESIPIILFGNKSDLIEKRVVKGEEAEEFSSKNNLDYFETSAKNNTNIAEGFRKIAEQAYVKAGGTIGMELKKGQKEKEGKGRKC